MAEILDARAPPNHIHSVTYAPTPRHPSKKIARSRVADGLFFSRRYHELPMIEIVISLPDDLREALDRKAPDQNRRDELVAAALRRYLQCGSAGSGDADLDIINSHADELNKEAEDALSYQVPL